MNIEEIKKTKEIVKERLKGNRYITGIGIAKDDKGAWCVKINVHYTASKKDLEILRKKLHKIPYCLQKMGDINFETVNQI